MKCVIPGNSKPLKKAAGALVITGSPYKKGLKNKIEEAKKKTILKKEGGNKSTSTKISQKENKKQEQDKNDSWYCIICQESEKENVIKCSQCEV